MSDGSSDSDTGSSSPDSAYVAPAARHHTSEGTLATLRAQTLQPLIHENGWYGSSDSDFQYRVAARGYSFPSSDDSQPRYVKRRDSDAVSMAVAYSSRSTTLESTSSSAYPPSLTSSSTAHSGSSVVTADPDSFLELRVLDDNDGVLEQPLPRMRCPYSILNCAFTSADLTEWETHGRSHFRSRLPEQCFCPFRGCSWAVTGQQAWGWRMYHLQTHQPANRVVAPVDAGHPDVEHLWRSKVLSNGQWKELKQYGSLGAIAAPSLRTARPSGEERRRG